MIYRKLGVDHITLYISYYDNNNFKYYKWLKSKYWIDIINYTVPNISFFYYGQDSKLNHCINNYRYNSKLVIVTDIDEIIVPKKKMSLKEIIYMYGAENSVFSFKSVLFTVDSINSSIFNASKSGCMISRGYEKMILRPEKINRIGAHFPKEWNGKGKIVTVDTNDAYVRHTRMTIGIKCYKIISSFYIDFISRYVESTVNSI